MQETEDFLEEGSSFLARVSLQTVTHPGGNETNLVGSELFSSSWLNLRKIE